MKAMGRALLFLVLLAGVLVGTPSSAQSLREQLFEAIDAGNAAEVTRLVRAGVHYTAKNDEGETPLYGAAMTGMLPVVKLLAEHGAAIQAADAAGNTPLHGAAESGNADLVAYLLSKRLRATFRNKAG